MILDLNEPAKYRDFYTPSTRRYIDQMPLLISGKDVSGKVIDIKRNPIQVAEIYERRVNSSKPDWWNYGFFTGDGVVVPAKEEYTDGRFKIRRNSESLRGINKETKLIMGGIPHESYSEVSGVEFMIKDVIVNRAMTRDEAIENPVLLELLGGDNSFMKKVIDKTYFEGKKQFNYDKMMGLFLPTELNQCHERAWYVDGLGDRSGVNGRSGFDDGDGCLLGIAPEAPKSE